MKNNNPTIYNFLTMELLILFFLFFVLTAASPSLKLDLMHHHQVDAAFGSLTRSDRIRELLRADLNRHVSISARISGGTIRAPMMAASDLGIGQYLVEVSVGSPPRKFRLIADTGSELMWMKCGDISRRGIVTYKLERSSTFQTVSCSSRTCEVDLKNIYALAKCPTPSSPCTYHYRYMDDSKASGFFAYDTVTLDFTNNMAHHKAGSTSSVKIDRVLVGCSQSIVGQALQVVDGVLGLGFSNQSFISKAGQAFSYCLVDHLNNMTLSSYLTFGPTTGPRMRYTALELDALPPFYAVNIFRISVGGKFLSVPSEVWAPSRGGGAILDSGTSLTYLTQPAYKLVVGAFDLVLRRFKRSGSGFGSMDYCFESTKEFNQSLVPRLAIHFVDGAKFEPPVKSYVIDVAPGVKCLGLISAQWPGLSVIGNIMQQTYLWSFNLADRKLGFAPSPCIST